MELLANAWCANSVCIVSRNTKHRNTNARFLKLGVGSEVPPVFLARGCKQCDHTGYRGRLGLLELLRFDSELDELVANRASVRELLKVARGKGYSTLADDGIRRVLEGVTSMDEIARVLDLTEGIQ